MIAVEKGHHESVAILVANGVNMADAVSVRRFPVCVEIIRPFELCCEIV